MTQRFKCLYATREKHPTFRVDLTELFTRSLGAKGHVIEWHMQSMTPARSSVSHNAAGECVYVGAAHDSGGLWGKFLNHLAGLRHDLRLYTLVRRGRYDFVQVRDKMFAAWIAMLAARACGIPFFYWMSFPYPDADRFRARDPQMSLSIAMRLFYRARGAFTAWLLYRVVLPRADHIFVQSDKMRADMQANGLAFERMTPVPMGVNLAELGKAAERTPPPTPWSGKRALIYMGTLVRLRRIDLLIDMLARVRAHAFDAVLVLIGDAPERDMAFLRAEAERLGVREHVYFTGFVPMDQAWTYTRTATVCLSPFRPSPVLDSTTPTKVVEYMALQRPVVANRHPDQSAVLEGSGAGLAVEYDAQAFADAVLRLLADPQRAEAMGARGLEYVRRHRSYEALSQQLEGRYLSLLGRPQTGALAEAAS